jgi:hypothetical protein
MEQQPQQPNITGTNDAGEIIFRLTDDQLKIVREVVNARELEELSRYPGFERFCQIAQLRITQIERQFMNPKVAFDKEASWVMRERLVAVQTFWNSLLEGIQVAKEALANPEEIEEALRAVAVNPADLAGEL